MWTAPSMRCSRDAGDVPWQAFTYAFLIPAGYHEHRWHSAGARVAVIQDALKVSLGETLGLAHMTVGSFLLVPANVKHTMAAKVDTLIIGTAVGPWARTTAGNTSITKGPSSDQRFDCYVNYPVSYDAARLGLTGDNLCKLRTKPK
jgi:hypothetical protein